MPTTPNPPAATAHATSAPWGIGSPRATPIASAATMPISCIPNTTPNSGARRLRSPPPKSPAPQLAAEMRPSARTATGPETSGRGHPLRLGQVDGGGTGELDDPLSHRVVAVRRREVDDLEVRRQVAQQLQRPGGTRI